MSWIVSALIVLVAAAFLFAIPIAYAWSSRRYYDPREDFTGDQVSAEEVA